MNIELYLILILVVAAVLWFAVPRVVGAYLKFRGKRLVTCPETKKPVGVDVDVKHAAATALLGETDLRLKNCTRWPEHGDCGQECLLQVRAWPEDCLISGMLAKWYEGKNCAFCGKEFGEIHALDHKPAFLAPEGKMIEWKDTPPERLPDMLATHQPVCWDCYVAEAFRQRYPELAVERPWKGDAHYEQ